MKEKIKRIILNVLSQYKTALKSANFWFIFFTFFIIILIIFSQKDVYWEIILANRHFILLIFTPLLLIFLVSIIYSKNKQLVISTFSILLLISFFLIQGFYERKERLNDFYFINHLNCEVAKSYSKGISMLQTPQEYFDSSFYRQNFGFVREEFGNKTAEGLFKIINKMSAINSFIAEVQALNRTVLPEALEAREEIVFRLTMLHRWIQEDSATYIEKSFLCTPRFDTY